MDSTQITKFEFQITNRQNGAIYVRSGKATAVVRKSGGANGQGFIFWLTGEVLSYFA